MMREDYFYGNALPAFDPDLEDDVTLQPTADVNHATYMRPEPPARDWNIAATTLHRLASLKENWDGEGANAPKGSAIFNASLFLTDLARHTDVPAPTEIAPIENGDILIIWRAGDSYWEAEVSDANEIPLMFRIRSQEQHKYVHTTFAIDPAPESQRNHGDLFFEQSEPSPFAAPPPSYVRDNI